MTQRIAVGLTLLAALFMTACGEDAKPQPAEPTLVFRTQPGSVRAGERLGAVEVAVVDSSGNVLADRGGTVQLSLVGAPEGAQLGGATRSTLAYGVARFTNLTVARAAAGMKLEVRLSEQTAQSAAFTVRPAAPAVMSLTSGPTDVDAGGVLPPMRVALQDAFGNAADEARTVAVELLGSTNGATLEGTTTVQSVNGVATFSELSVDKDGDYALRFTSDGLPFARSASFKVRPGEPVSITFSTQPAESTEAGVTLAPVQVTLLDRKGNVARRAEGNVSLELVAANGATLLGTATAAVAEGLATFEGLSVQKAGTGYVLRAGFGELTPADSSAFAITASAPVRLAYVAAPGASVAGAVFAPAVQVEVLDRFDNRTTASSGTVTVALEANPGNATLNGTLSVETVDGVASFADLSINTAAQGYSLGAFVGGLPGVTSGLFDVAPAAASAVAFTTQPSNIVAGVAMAQAVAVTVRDAFGNLVTNDTREVVLALGNNPNGGVLSGTTRVALANGAASFPGLTVERAATGYTLAATLGELPAVQSSAFNVTPATADRFATVVQPPETVVAGEAMGTITIEARDRFDNPVTSFGSAGQLVRAGVDPARDPSGATVGGTRFVTITNGRASFTGLTLDKVGPTEIMFQAMTSAGVDLFRSYSRPVNVTPTAAAGIAFRRVPAQAQAGSALGPAVQVEVTDRFGNATSGSGEVTLSLGANPGQDSLRGTLTVAVTDGVATFADLVLEKAGRGYTLKASMTGVATVTSAAFDVLGAEPTRVAFVAQPRSTPAGLPLNEVSVALVDVYGNRATSTASVTLALGNANGAVLGGTLTVAAQDGVARFGNLSVDRNGQGYTLAASSGSLVGADSDAFDVYGAALAYTDPTAGRIRLVRNPASTATRVVLDVVATEDLVGYGAGFNLPLDATKVQLPAQGAITAGAVLSPGNSVPALAAALPASGPMSGVLTSGISQKAAGAGAVATDSPIAAGSVLYQLVLELRAGAEPGVVFDGASLGSGFKGLLRNKLGDDVVGSSGFGIGRLELTGSAGFQQTAQR